MRWISYVALTSLVLAGGWAERAFALVPSEAQVVIELAQNHAGGAVAGQANEGDQEWGNPGTPEGEPDLANPDDDLDVPSPDEPEEDEGAPEDGTDEVPPSGGEGGGNAL